MKILHLISSTGYFGAETVVLNICDMLQAEFDLRIGIISNNRKINEQFENEAKNKSISTLNFECHKKFDLKTINNIRNYVKSENIQILHSHGYKSNFYSLLSCANMPYIKKVTTCHNWTNYNKKLKIYSIIDRHLLRFMDKIVGVSEPVFSTINGIKGCQKKSILIYNGIKIAQNNQENVKRILVKHHINEKSVVVGTVGRLSVEKGHKYLIKGFKKIIDKNFNAILLIVGSGPLTKTLKVLVEKENIRNYVIFAGYQKNIRLYYEVMDIFVMASLKEGLPLALLEAMSFKLPVIVTNVGQMPDIVKNNTSGIVIDKSDVEQIATALETMINNPNRKSQWGESSINVIKEYYSVERMANQYSFLYTQLVSQP